MDTNHNPLGCKPDSSSSSTVQKPRNNIKVTNLPKPHSSSTQAKPNLLEVPFEIRHRILSLLVGVDENRDRTHSWVSIPSPECPAGEPVRVETTCKLHPNILRVCKQLNEEGRLILHQENRYVALGGFPDFDIQREYCVSRFPSWKVWVRDPREHESSNPCHLYLARGMV
jgi:hypothetical protein